MLEAILLHRTSTPAPRMVKPPVVFVAGSCGWSRRRRREWVWYCQGAGQQLFYPPDVSGWDDSRWLDTSTVRGRFDVVSRDNVRPLPRRRRGRRLRRDRDPRGGGGAARAWAGDPNLTTETVAALTTFAADALAGAGGWQLSTYRGLRQNALRQLILASPDYQTS